MKAETVAVFHAGLAGARSADDLGPKTRPVDWIDELARQAVAPIPTHLPALDLRLRGGMRRGKILIVGGVPGSWKTALLAQLASRMAAAGLNVLYWAGDEGPESLVVRLAQHVGVSREEAERGSPHAREELVKATAHGRLVVPDPDDMPYLEDVLAAAASLPEPRALFIDSLQALPLRDEPEKRHEAIEARMAMLRREARRLGLLVFAVSEIGRASYGSSDDTAGLAAFKGSGSIEYKGDTLLLLKPAREREEEVRVTIPKNRQGSRGSFTMAFNAATCLGSEVTEAEQEQRERDRKDEEFEQKSSHLLGILQEAAAGSDPERRKLSFNQLDDRAGGNRQENRKILAALERQGKVRREPGPNRSGLWSLP